MNTTANLILSASSSYSAAIRTAKKNAFTTLTVVNSRGLIPGQVLTKVIGCPETRSQDSLGLFGSGYKTKGTGLVPAPFGS